MSSVSSSTVTYKKSGLIIVKDPGDEVQPLNCPVCSFFMLTVYDESAWKESGCCQECSIMWAEGPNRERWQNGWRPEPDVLQKEIEKRSKLVPRLKLRLK